MMALDDDDRAEISSLIAESLKANTKPPTGSRRPPAASPSGPEGDWDHLSPIDQRGYVRQVVAEALAEQDAAWERENLQRENEELKAKIKEWEKAGKPGRRPTRSDLDGKREEQMPQVVSKVYKFLFGDATAAK